MLVVSLLFCQEIMISTQNFNIPIVSNFANHHNIFSSASEGVASIVSGSRLLLIFQELLLCPLLLS